jgi:uncharacterized membrane protein YdbT with pleckstrin-like domain
MHLETDEVILRIIRKHPFYVIVETVGLGLMALIPVWIEVLINYLGSLVGSGVINNFDPSQLGWSPLLGGFLYSLWLLTLWLIFIAIFSDYYLDKWVITNKRVIDIEQRGFFARETSSVRFDKIQDVTVNVAGLIPTILNFGSISVQSAGVEQEFTLKDAPNPLNHKEFIMEQKHISLHNSSV